MSSTTMTVSIFMNSPVVSVTPQTTLDAAHRILVERRISSVPVIEPDGRAVGVLSDTDLLRVGRLEPAPLAGVRLLDFPAEPVGQHMHAGIITVSPDTPAATAARMLAEQHIHRVFVQEEGRIIGVFSTEQVLVALRATRLGTPVEAFMTSPVETISLYAPLSEATARLDRAHMTGLAVVDEHEHPVGVFTKTEALWSRGVPSSAAVETVMSYALIHQNAKTPVFRAAAHAYETRSRRVFVMNGHKVGGMLTGLDFARALASAS
jgi:CBS domain-containing protein